MEEIQQAHFEEQSIILCVNSQGHELRATPVRLMRHLVVFEVYNPFSILQLSEVLQEFQIIINQRVVYSGRAVVSNLVNTGIFLVCEASLEEGWLDVDLTRPLRETGVLKSEFDHFITEYKKHDVVMPAFKLVVADIQSFLIELRRWLEQLEFAVRSNPSGERHDQEVAIINQVMDPVLPMLNEHFIRFESVADSVEQALQPMHRSYVKRQLHPIVLCAPFSWRTYTKPLGYAGDYEMVNMMARAPYEGSSLFAKILNTFFLKTPPVVAHRNRIQYLKENLTREIWTIAKQGRKARIFNLGCGPAIELQQLLENEVADHAEILLLDFNEETLRSVQQIFGDLVKQHERTTEIRTQLKSVHQILKEAGKAASIFAHDQYDVVYCAGLFDYLSDRICKRLTRIFYDILAPGGLMITTNVHSDNPSRHWMEFVVDWHLVYRDDRSFLELTPHQVPKECVKLEHDSTGVNVFNATRKPQ
ncbi:MAG: class I SAM-dependent methyltransferase [Verrucomicrobiota bacterium]|nr:class I SAM-dependent methyltransferase [Verrucomicrobiota bacterium]